MTFTKVYATIVKKAVDSKIITDIDKIPGYSESEKSMNQNLKSEYEKQNTINKKKSMFGLFKKGE